ncbi:MAG: glycosyltransferase [Eubacteriales bacterium]|nr:glycosyltransferase [Eubacteriales bacterium]
MNFSDQKLGFVDYLYKLTDDTGIFQHSVYGIPDPRKGYTTDDNSRALILAVMLLESYKEKNFSELVSEYLAFLLNAQNENGTFKNFMNYQREFTEEKGSEDCFGRCMWALGRTISSAAIPENIKRTCQHLLNKSLENWPKLTSPRAKASSIVGLSYLIGTDEITGHIETLSMELVSQYKQFKDGDWHWFENSMTYGNAILPWSLFRAYIILKKDILLKTARESMDFLEEITCKNGYFKPIGCNSWLLKGKNAAEYDEQPVEACETLLSFLEYYKITSDKKYLDHAVKCFCWYTGQNSKSLSLIDEETGACYDGLTENGLNYNQGSESIVSYGISIMEISLLISLNDQLASER